MLNQNTTTSTYFAYPFSLPFVDIGVAIPHVFSINSNDILKKITLACQHFGVSDIFIQPDRPICVAIEGILHAITPRLLDVVEVWNLLNVITERVTAKTDIMGGKAVNASYVLQDSTQKSASGLPLRYYYRVNATGISVSGGGDAVQIVMRAIPVDPPTYDKLGVNNDILYGSTPKQGIVYIAGATGSGKTTTFAAIMRYILENDTPIQGNIVTYEEPIEFRYNNIVSKHSIISQSEVPRNIPNFYDGIREAMRRKPELILIGELRDQETIMSAIEASVTGHAVFATVHATNVASVLNRLVYRLPEGDRGNAIYKLVDATRFIMAQKLIMGVNGKRVATREYLMFTREIIEDLIMLPSEMQVTQKIREYVNDCGNSFAQDAKRLYEEGKIDAKVRDEVIRG
jgi:defect-in-organelle-trafficking protein DotB